MELLPLRRLDKPESIFKIVWSCRLKKRHSEEAKLKISKKAKERIRCKPTKETIEKIAVKIRKEWHIITPEGEHLIIENMLKFCDENPFFKYDSIRGAIKRTNGIYKGHKVYCIDKKHK